MMKYTALHDVHVKMGAKMTEFGGYHMPLWYTSIIDEHKAVRESVGMFDVSHMGDILVEGPDATEFLSYVLPTDFSKVKVMKASYTAFMNHRGVLIDDTIVTKLGDDSYLLVPNAATAEQIYHFIYSMAGGYDVEIKNLTQKLSCIAVQGRNAQNTLQKLTDYDLGSIGFFEAAYIDLKGVDIKENELAGKRVFISRTGYTGEDGFEIVLPNENAEEVWYKILGAGEGYGIKPCGLGARDTLRMEKGFLLSGQDFHPLHEPRTPLEAGISWIIDWDHEFIGKERLAKMKAEKKYDLFRGILLRGRGIPRHGYEIYKDGEKIGYLTSGTMSPILNVGIGLGYVKRPYIKVGTEVQVNIRGRMVPAEIRKPKLVK
ncbi:glycine cleavage system T protein [Aciduliprofundum sp. MAR08-339]|uniref:glycine cleavage system aminomethyltransferase GcvT n=1 Tax=Aciduliprofundum sp. (strain MAR08-339) TaxID=673860 RepID=UPI0002A49767|nr:glycine cleavage system T protein [Aciduliprofundum sp. MAR08-339]